MIVAAVTTMYLAKRKQVEGFLDWRQTSDSALDGEERLRKALQAVRPSPTSSSKDTYDVWTELFSQHLGGQLLVQGKGAGIHSSSDVIVNSENPYAEYLLDYDEWVAKLRAMAFPTVSSFASGITGVFCGAYDITGPRGTDQGLQRVRRRDSS